MAKILIKQFRYLNAIYIISFYKSFYEYENISIIMLKGWKATREEIKRREKEKRMTAIKRLGELIEKTGATSEENIKIIREVREES